MGQAQVSRVQGLALDITVIRIVKKVARQRVADIFLMNADLVRPSCLEEQADERQVRVFVVGQSFVVGHCRLAQFWFRDPFNGGTVLSGDGNVDGSGGFSAAAYDGGVFPVDAVVLYLIGKDAGAQHVFCNHKKTGRVTVQPVYSAEDEIHVLLLHVPSNAVGQRVAVVSLRRMGRHAGRFVDHHHVLVFI